MPDLMLKRGGSRLRWYGLGWCGEGVKQETKEASHWRSLIRNGTRAVAGFEAGGSGWVLGRGIHAWRVVFGPWAWWGLLPLHTSMQEGLAPLSA